MASRRHAFTLVELSIVLVILGLLVGGVLAGQSLIRAAELRAITTEHSRYLAATHSFRDKYFALPGDMTNAQSFWGIAHATASNCITTAGTGTQTCNGDGNGVVNHSPAAGSNERYRFWQHLANAGLIEGTYDGITHGTNATSSTAENSPKSKLSSAHWGVSWIGVLTVSSDFFLGSYGHTMTLGKLVPNTIPYAPILKPEELWNIDTKLDDGKPALGNVVLLGFGTLTTCTNAANNTDTNANYLLSATTTSCAIALRNQF